MFTSSDSYFVTLTFNWRGFVTPSAMRQALGSFGRRLDEHRLGKRFYNYEARQRTLFVFVPEKVESYPHYHGLVARPDDTKALRAVADFPSLMQSCWTAVVPAGVCNVRPLKDAGALDYASKERTLLDDHVIVASDFWNAQST